MATKIFLTGVTGYIGGDALDAITTAHPDYSITALVRSPDKGAKVAQKYVSVRLVYGDLDSKDVIEEEAAKADIVCHFADCDHEPSANAIIAGLAKGHDKSKPGWFIHTSGTGILEVDDLLRETYGTSAEKVYDDWDGIKQCITLPDQAWHRNVDKIVLAGPEKSCGAVKTAIVCPPTIYGPGRGPDKGRSDQVYKMAEAVMKRGKGFMVGEGKNRWTQIHVHDLSSLYLLLVEAAAEGGGKATWDQEGYYFAENGEYYWGDMAKAVAKEVKKQGFIKTDEMDSVSKDEVNEIMPAGIAKWGMNSRCKAIRGRKLFGWTPKGKSLMEELPGIVEGEARVLGLKKGHAEVATGDA
ncbi:NAD(P)-binding protein [Aulographum hederae CBS 113979]|uniref:NAD(P)-binding protein n=1 Tax=Aulographum hederae CBS 113979 TaxID=1176131 RepID=A0A6G1H324_9PEZI|nr:NAD(P)-binding protein [Aulographum hederae CBS 113979]